jgi:protein-S-isoprenylcysteine O-methyltransferase Ste14
LLPLIDTHPAAAAIFLAACAVWLVPEMIGMYRQMAPAARPAAVVQDRGSLAILLALQWAGLGLNFALAGLFPSAAMAWPRTALFLIGVLLMVAGVALRWYAIWTLGRYFTRDVAVSLDQPVVQHGPYRLIRHPAYSGTFLTMVGVGLALSNWAGLIALLAGVLAGHFYRVRIEESALIRTLGQPYVDYMRRTKRFIPLVF